MKSVPNELIDVRVLDTYFNGTDEDRQTIDKIYPHLSYMFADKFKKLYYQMIRENCFPKDGQPKSELFLNPNSHTHQIVKITFIYEEMKA